MVPPLSFPISQCFLRLFVHIFFTHTHRSLREVSSSAARVGGTLSLRPPCLDPSVFTTHLKTCRGFPNLKLKKKKITPLQQPHLSLFPFFQKILPELLRHVCSRQWEFCDKQNWPNRCLQRADTPAQPNSLKEQGTPPCPTHRKEAHLGGK